jgi:SAM-dependent methyltransferase
MSDFKRIAEYYDRLAERFGADPRSVDASSADTLEVRYQTLSEVATLAGKSILEVGCGFGGLGEYLVARNDDMRYLGIDVSRRMIDLGRAIHPELELREGNVLELEAENAFDFVLAQGIFYLLSEEADVTVRRIVERMFSLAREAVAFSAISTWASAPDSNEYRIDPLRMLEFVRRLTTFVVLRHDYHPGDVTFYLYKLSTG